MRAQRDGVEVYLCSFFNIIARWGCVQNATLQPLNPREKDPIRIVQEAGWAIFFIFKGAEKCPLYRVLNPELSRA